MSIIYRIIKWGAHFIGQKELRVPNSFQKNLQTSFEGSEKFQLPNFCIRKTTGQEIQFKDLRGKKVLLVNVASKCGYTPQYPELEKLYKENESRLMIIGFPSNEFGKQEPGSNKEIQNFCEINYGVTFPISEKAEVKSKNKCELYEWLTNPNKNGWNAKEPTWNFCKYLIDEKGFLVGYFPSHVIPEI